MKSFWRRKKKCPRLPTKAFVNVQKYMNISDYYKVIYPTYYTAVSPDGLNFDTKTIKKFVPKLCQNLRYI